MRQQISVKSHYFDLWSCITSSDLRNIADNMDNDGIQYIDFSFDSGANNLDITEYSTRFENESEEQQRLKNNSQYIKQKLQNKNA